MMTPEELYDKIESNIFKQLRGDWVISNRNDASVKSELLIKQYRKEIEKGKCKKCKHNFEDKTKPNPYHDIEKYYSTE